MCSQVKTSELVNYVSEKQGFQFMWSKFIYHMVIEYIIGNMDACWKVWGQYTIIIIIINIIIKLLNQYFSAASTLSVDQKCQ